MAIQEMVKNYLVGCIHGAKAEYGSLSGYDKSTVDYLAKELLGELSKMGVVRKVERELPGAIMDGQIAWGKEDYRKILERFGYVAVEPLVEGAFSLPQNACVIIN